MIHSGAFLHASLKYQNKKIMLLAIIFITLRKRILQLIRGAIGSTAIIFLLSCFILPSTSFANNGERTEVQIENRELAKEGGFTGIRIRTLTNKSYKGYAVHSDGNVLRMVSFNYKEAYEIKLSRIQSISQKEPSGPFSIFHFSGIGALAGGFIAAYVQSQNSRTTSYDRGDILVGAYYGFRVGALASLGPLMRQSLKAGAKFDVDGSLAQAQIAFIALSIKEIKMII